MSGVQPHISWTITKPKRPLCIVRSARRHHRRDAAAAATAAVVLGLGNVGSGEKKNSIEEESFLKEELSKYRLRWLRLLRRRQCGVPAWLPQKPRWRAARGSPRRRREGDSPSPSWCGVFFQRNLRHFYIEIQNFLWMDLTIFLGNPLVHSCLKGTNNSRNLFSNLFQ